MAQLVRNLLDGYQDIMDNKSGGLTDTVEMHCACAAPVDWHCGDALRMCGTGWLTLWRCTAHVRHRLTDTVEMHCACAAPERSAL